MVGNVFVGFRGNGAGVRTELFVTKTFGVIEQARLAFAPEVRVQCKHSGRLVFFPQERG
jgi:hypothetical protein